MNTVAIGPVPGAQGGGIRGCQHTSGDGYPQGAPDVADGVPSCSRLEGTTAGGEAEAGASAAQLLSDAMICGGAVRQ